MLTKKQIEKLLQGVFNGELSLFNLPKDVFEFTYSELITVVDKGFGGGVGDFVEGSLRDTVARNSRNNIFTFSGAKTFQEVKDLSLFVFNEDGTKRTFKEFREFGRQINEIYNVDWLRSEQDTAFGMAQSKDQWIDIEEDKELFPMLTYETVGDSRVRDEHAAWDGLTFPVNHEFWNTRMPINDWGCRCTVSKHAEGKTSSLKGVPKNDSKMFNVNPGKVDYVFDPKVHPYYKVEKRFKPMMKDNFGFKLPEK